MLMEELFIEETRRTPGILVTPKEGKFYLTGRSIPDNAIEFYKPLVDRIQEYVKKPLNKSEIHLNLDYANTSSSKVIIDFLKSFRFLGKNDQLDIHLYFDEDDDELYPENYSFLLNDYKKIASNYKCSTYLIIHTKYSDDHEELKKVTLK